MTSASSGAPATGTESVSQVPDGWLTMDTAPTDGTVILGWYGDAEQNRIRWADERHCVLASVAPGAGLFGPGWEDEANSLYVEDPLAWKPATGTEPQAYTAWEDCSPRLLASTGASCDEMMRRSGPNDEGHQHRVYVGELASPAGTEPQGNDSPFITRDMDVDMFRRAVESARAKTSRQSRYQVAVSLSVAESVLAALDRVRALHKRRDTPAFNEVARDFFGGPPVRERHPGYSRCDHCQTEWPCATVSALSESEESSNV